jgi:hypothetical protein
MADDAPELSHRTSATYPAASHNDSNCHARAITLGNGLYPGRDTYQDDSPGHPRLQATAGTGACKLSGWLHNSDFACTADGIDLAARGETAACMSQPMQ